MVTDAKAVNAKLTSAFIEVINAITKLTHAIVNKIALNIIERIERISLIIHCTKLLLFMLFF